MYYVEMSKIDAAAPRLLLKSEWMVETNKECNSHPFTSPLKKDGIPQFPSKFCGMVDGYRPFKDGYPSLPFIGIFCQAITWGLQKSTVSHALQSVKLSNLFLLGAVL